MSKERLVELLGNAPIGVNGITLLDKHEPKAIEEIADYIIADGWIRPPCKVGDEVYWYNMGGNISEAYVVLVGFVAKTKGFEYDIDFNEIGKTVFLTREEAEAKLIEEKQ